LKKKSIRHKNSITETFSDGHYLLEGYITLSSKSLAKTNKHSSELAQFLSEEENEVFEYDPGKCYQLPVAP
jgi:hypothetical protein